MTQLDDNTFIDFIKAGPCLLLYETAWCPMCPAVREILAALGVRCGRLDYDTCPEAVCLHDVPGVPTVLLLHNGKIEQTLAGLRPPEQYTALALHLSAK